MKLITRIAYTVVAVSLIIGLFFLLSDNEATGKGQIDVLVYDQSETVVIEESHLFYEGDTLFKVLQRHYDLTCADSQYNPDTDCETSFSRGRILLGIDGVQTDWNHTFLYLEKDGSMANYGVDNIELEDNSDYAFYVKNVND